MKISSLTVFHRNHFQPYFSEQALGGARKFVGGTSVMTEINGEKTKEEDQSKRSSSILTRTMKRC